MARDIADKQIAGKLFGTIAPRFAERPGGYTRVLHLGRRQGDAAEVAQIELVGSEYDPSQDRDADDAAPAADAAKKKGMGGRLRAAAKRLRRGQDAEKSEETA